MSRNSKAFVIVLVAMILPLFAAGLVVLAGGSSDDVVATFVLGEVVCILFGMFAGMLVDP